MRKKTSKPKPKPADTLLQTTNKKDIELPEQELRRPPAARRQACQRISLILPKVHDEMATVLILKYN